MMFLMNNEMLFLNANSVYVFFLKGGLKCLFGDGQMSLFVRCDKAMQNWIGLNEQYNVVLQAVRI